MKFEVSEMKLDSTKISDLSLIINSKTTIKKKYIFI